jgi:hypothetical protein
VVIYCAVIYIPWAILITIYSEQIGAEIWTVFSCIHLDQYAELLRRLSCDTVPEFVTRQPAHGLHCCVRTKWEREENTKSLNTNSWWDWEVIKKTGKLIKHYAMKACGGVDVWIHIFLTSAALPPVLTGEEVGWTPEPVLDDVEKR